MAIEDFYNAIDKYNINMNDQFTFIKNVGIRRFLDSGKTLYIALYG